MKRKERKQKRVWTLEDMRELPSLGILYCTCIIIDDV
jgi:hypothetical protein